MSKPHFIYAKSSRMNEVNINKGNIIMVPDTNELYIDFSNTNRVRIGVGDPLGKLGIQLQLDSKASKTHTHPYISDIKISGNRINYTKGNNTTGFIDIPDMSYTLPTATHTILGGIKIYDAHTVGSIGWDEEVNRNSDMVPTISTIAYWDGSYNKNGTSNLAYCIKGKFGDATTLAKSNILSSISLSGTTLSYTKADGTTGNFTTQDHKYSNMKAATASAAGAAGLVPAPAAGKNTSFLRGDGTWVVPANTTYSDVTTSSSGLATADMLKKTNALTPISFSVAVSAWVSNTSGCPGCNYAANITVSGITVNDSADIIFNPGSMQTCKTANISPAATTNTNVITIFAVNKPTAVVSGSIVIFKA